MPDFADDTSTELERKAKALKVVCIIETVSYMVLFTFWVSGNDVATKIFGAIHGQFFVLFAAMVIGMWKPMRWSLRFMAAALLTGPIGAVIVYEHLRRHGVPNHPPLEPVVTGRA
ncbi:MAG: DUF3817 domain-containing protein [Actinobacteria bacterium]|nr:DUF3817 domain-containing protein [Actinomycetota bacterium]MBW3650741.1 DUF3817 domain-containing protein [Actinomycetota bacterium]